MLITPLRCGIDTRAPLELLKALESDERLYDRTPRAVKLSMLTFTGPARLDRLRDAYDRATFPKQRTVMMQAWADDLDGMATTGKVVVQALELEAVEGGPENSSTPPPVNS